MMKCGILEKKRGGVNDRTIGCYQEQLFPDDFKQSDPNSEEHQNQRGWSAEYMLREAKPKDYQEQIFGGYEAAFHAGKTVLDIASGQALGIIQLATRFPNTSFIGADILYEHERVVFPGKPGVQLTKADWRVLRTISDHSVDTILSLQGIGMWGMPGQSVRHSTTQEDGEKIIAALTRVAKSGAVVRIDGHPDFLYEKMNEKIWEVVHYEHVFIARKR